MCSPHDRAAKASRTAATACQVIGPSGVLIEGPVTREHYRELDLPRLYAFGLSRAFHFDVDTSGLIVQDRFGERAAGGVRISQREELTTCADELIEAAQDPCERDLLRETRDAILAYYEAEVAA